MTQDPKFAVQLLEKIGAPLAAAIESVPLEGEEKDVEAAKLMAQMLGQSVQISIALGTTLSLEENEEQADATRVALASLAAPLIANHYRHNSRIAEETDIKRMTKSLEAVLAFAENFSPASDEASRIATLENNNPLFDKTQTTLVVLQSLTPVINAVAEFPFGFSETKLVQEISDRLEGQAAEIATANGMNDKLSELLIFKSLAQIYTECHMAETVRLANAPSDSREELSLDPVWDAYETKVEMVKTLMGGDSSAPNEATDDSPAEPIQAEAPPTTPAEDPTPVAPPPPPPATATGGPMGFFAKKDDQSPPAVEETAPAQPVEPASAPAEDPTPVAPPPPPAETPPAEQPPAESGSDGAGGSPMSFFKPGPKTDNDGGEAET